MIIVFVIDDQVLLCGVSEQTFMLHCTVVVMQSMYTQWSNKTPKIYLETNKVILLTIVWQ